jgi:2-polyprenyl-3-methyl-5-hydroxy-6-metoxy-1,4-benzoquinol methylase
MDSSRNLYFIEMDYDPIKARLARLFLRTLWMKRLLFFFSRQVFLRELEVRNALRGLKQRGLRGGSKMGLKGATQSATKPLQILDAGTGYGQYALYLATLFPDARVTTVDIKDDCVEAMDALRQQAGLQHLTCRQADLSTLQERELYDLILNVDVMEHIADDQRVFDQFAQALKAGGTLLLHTPALPESASDEEHPERAMVGEHVREGYKHSTIRRRLQRAGFEQIEIRSTYDFWGGVAWQLGVRQPMRLMRVSLLFLPLVLLWLILALVPIRLLNSLSLNSSGEKGGCLLLLARRAAVHPPEQEAQQEAGERQDG